MSITAGIGRIRLIRLMRRPARGGQVGLIGLIGLIGLMPFVAGAADFSSTNYIVENPTIDELTGTSSSTNFTVQGSIPYISPIPQTSTSFGNNPGAVGYPGVTLPVLTAVAGTNAGEIDLSWTAAINLANANYEVGIAPTYAGGPYTYDSGRSGLTKTQTGLQPLTRFYFIIRVKDGLGEVIGYSNETSAVPTNPGVGGGTGQGGGGGGGGSGVEPTPSTPGLVPLFVEQLENALTQTVGDLGNFLTSLVPDFLKPGAEAPPPIAQNDLERFVPRRAPPPLAGRWTLLPPGPIKELAFRPLPRAISDLASKFPHLGKLFAEVGITKFQDLERLRNVKLKVPGLADFLALPPPGMARGLFVPPSGLFTISELTADLKARLPADVLFARVGGGKIDLAGSLKVDASGVPHTQVSTITGKQVVLVVKPEGKPKSVKGYFIFKGRVTSANNESVTNKRTGSIGRISPIRRIGRIPTAQAAEESDVNGQESDVVTTELVLLEFEFTDPDGDGIYEAAVPVPQVAGNYEVLTIVDYGDEQQAVKAIRFLAVVDPEGYIYEEQNGKELRIPGAIAILEWLNPDTKKYEAWPAAEFAQENPQVTGITGEYSYLVPPGFYRLRVTAPGYLTYEGKPFEVTEGTGVHTNIALKTRFWFLKVIDWKTVLLVIIGLLLLYNFYRDRRRDERASNPSPPNQPSP